MCQDGGRGACSRAPFLEGLFPPSVLSFQAILEENKEKLPLAISPVAYPRDHVFRCAAPFSARDETSLTPPSSHNP